MQRQEVVRTRVQSLQDMMKDLRLEALALSHHGNVAWLSAGGRVAVGWGSPQGVAWIVVTPGDVLVVTGNNEADRLIVEEFAGLDWRPVIFPWWEGPEKRLRELLPNGGRVGADFPPPGFPGAIDVGPVVAALRAQLDQEQQELARSAGRDVGLVLAAVSREIQPGMTEHEIAGRLTGALVSRGMDVPVCLIGTDERFFHWRHFMPTERRLERYVCLTVCARRSGLIFSATRLVHFGTPAPELSHRLEAVQRIDAALIAATRPGVTAVELFALARSQYAENGYAEEWRNHHQGGLTGYEPREWTIRPDGSQTVRAGQMYAWNPTVPGAKSEDTILVGPAEAEILTDSGDFPYVDVEAGDRVVRRPALLIR